LKLNCLIFQESEIKNLKKSIDTLTHDVSSRVQSLAEKDSQLKLAQDEYETFEKQKDIDLENLNNQLKQSSESLLAQNKQLLDKLQTLEAHYDESKKANVELQDRITELMRNSGDNSTQLISLNEKIDEKEK
jgi:chromosome segregation ATPase